MADEHRWLKYCALFYALGLALHTADHVRRGLDVVTPQVQWAGNLSTALGVAAAVMVIVGHRFGPMLAETVIEVGRSCAPPGIFLPNFDRRFPHEKTQIIIKPPIFDQSLVTLLKCITPRHENDRRA